MPNSERCARYRQRKEERMEQKFKLFSSVVKAHYLSGAEPSEVASEVS